MAENGRYRQVVGWPEIRARNGAQAPHAQAAAHYARAQPHAIKLRFIPAQGRIRVKDLRAFPAHDLRAHF